MPIFDISCSNQYKAGNTKNCVSAWQDITSDVWILNNVKGVKIPFKDVPTQDRIPFPYKLSGEELEALDFELKLFLNKGVIEPAFHCDGEFISNLFLREKPNGRHRVILDLTTLNNSIKYEKFKMSNLSTALELMSEGCYMASIDLSDAYYSVPIHPDHRQYLRFVWKGDLYQFVGMPNGLACAPRIFTKLMVPVFTCLREQNMICFNYLDDSFIMDYDFESSENTTLTLASLLQSLGFFVHPQKSVFHPSTHIEFLGFILDSEQMTVTLTDEKVTKFEKFANYLLHKKQPRIRECARMVGLMTAYSAGIDYGNAHIKNIEKVKNFYLQKNVGDFEKRMRLNNSARNDIYWWLNNITSFRKIRYDSPTQDIYSDASNQGWGAHDENQETGGRWSTPEQIFHINVLELKAIYFGLKTLWNGSSEILRVFTDNTTALAYVNKKGGIRSQECNDVAKEIWAFCEENNLMITAQHIPGVDNVLADFRSRNFSDSLEWTLKSRHFNRICQRLGVPSVDLFATRLNAKCEKFVSWQPDPEAWKFDAFSFHWGQGLLYYAFPPFSLIARVLQKLENDQRQEKRGPKAQLILVTPNWPSQPFYPILKRKAYKTLLFRKDTNLENPHLEGFENTPLIASLFWI